MAMKEQLKRMEKFRKAGLSANKVISDMAANADYLAMYLGSSMKAMAETAAYTAEMGYGLSISASIASKLMDWETSIRGEMEMSQLLGRTINFDRARQLMLEEDHVGMLKEVKRQLGGELQWTKMGVVQRERMGELIGLQGTQLAEFMMTEQQKVENAAKAAALTVKQTEEQRKMDAAAAAEKAKMWGLIGLAAGAVVVAIGAGLAAAVTLGTGGTWGAAKTLAAFLGGGVVGGAAGYKIGSVASKSIGQGVITPDGTIVQTDPRDFIMAGTASELTASRTKSGAMGTDNKKLIAQNDEIITLLRKMPTYLQSEEFSRDQVSATKKVGLQI